MEDYTKLYHLLFNAITDALEQMNAQNFGSAKETLVSAQQKAEDRRGPPRAPVRHSPPGYSSYECSR